MKKLAVLSVCFVVFLVLLIGINILHFRYLTVDVVFYSTLADVIGAAAVTGLIVAIPARFSRTDSRIGNLLGQFSSTEITLFSVCAILSGYIFAISVPTVIDRSLSIYILEKLDQRGGEIPFAAMRDVFVNEYVPEYRLVDVRMTEQLSSGTITIEDGCVKLTARGRRIVDFTRFYRTSLLPKKRVLMGEVTDDLVDPFQNSISAAEYQCEPSDSVLLNNQE